jgi:hypothetical protein
MLDAHKRAGLLGTKAAIEAAGCSYQDRSERLTFFLPEKPDEPMSFLQTSRKTHEDHHT